MNVPKTSSTPLAFTPKPAGRRRSLIEWRDHSKQAHVLDWRHRAQEFGLEVEGRAAEDPDSDVEPARLLADDEPEAYTRQVVPGSDDFDWKAVNYAPIALAILFVFVAVMWFTNGKKHFTGMRRTVDESADK